MTMSTKYRHDLYQLGMNQKVVWHSRSGSVSNRGPLKIAVVLLLPTILKRVAPCVCF